MTANKLSRTRNLDMEWSLEESIFNQFQDIYGHFDTDLFASAKNRKCVKSVFTEVHNMTAPRQVKLSQVR